MLQTSNMTGAAHTAVPEDSHRLFRLLKDDLAWQSSQDKRRWLRLHQQHVTLHIARGLSRKSTSVFADPATLDPCDMDAVLAGLNCLAVSQGMAVSLCNLPVSSEGAVNSGGVISPYVEVLRFGRWLMLDGAPGFRQGPGLTADKMTVLRTVAAAAGEMHFRKLARKRAKNGWPLPKSASRKIMTRTHLRDRWAIMYGELLDADAFRRRLGSAERYISAYLAYLTTQRGGKCGTRKVRSKLLEEVHRQVATPVNR